MVDTISTLYRASEQAHRTDTLIRQFKLFVISDDADLPNLEVSHIHNRQGYREIRRVLARSYDLAYLEPDIQVRDADLRGNRELKLVHTVSNGIELVNDSRDEVLKHVRRLWGYDVSLKGVDRDSGREIYARTTKKPKKFEG